MKAQLKGLLQISSPDDDVRRRGRNLIVIALLLFVLALVFGLMSLLTGDQRGATVSCTLALALCLGAISLARRGQPGWAAGLLIVVLVSRLGWVLLGSHHSYVLPVMVVPVLIATVTLPPRLVWVTTMLVVGGMVMAATVVGAGLAPISPFDVLLHAIVAAFVGAIGIYSSATTGRTLADLLEARQALGATAARLAEAAVALQVSNADLEARVAARTAELVAEREALRESEERFRQLADNINETFWILDVATQRMVYLNATYKRLWGTTLEVNDLTLEQMFALVHPDDVAQVKADFALDRPFTIEHRVVRPDGTLLRIRSRGFPISRAGAIYRVVGVSEDVTEQRQFEQQLVHDALHDALTGLPNRAAFLARLGQVVAHAASEPAHGFAILFMDMDGFKSVNDAYGHLVGDQLLVEMGQLINSQVRPGDLVARLGGDEFVVLLEHVNQVDQVLPVAERLLSALARPFALADQVVSVSVSIGVALSQDDTAQSLLQKADQALYHAKHRGKACIVVFRPGVGGVIL